MKEIDRREAVENGDYIVYVDESGDHGLQSTDPNYPLFVLAFCIFEKSALANTVVPAMLRFKFAHFGHDQVVLHEHEIRKAKNAFRFLTDASLRAAFMKDMSTLIDIAPFTIVAIVIQKERLVKKYHRPENPYAIGLEYGLERVCAFLHENGQDGKLTHFVFECRGPKEDKELELEFRRVTGGANATCSKIPIEIIMADKKTITTGLQLADLVARPIGLHVLRPEQVNRAYDLIQPKLRRGPRGQLDGFGLEVFPL
ncbi:MAG: DUF3800 domain-containing protein [Gemmatimonas sp.]|jgi:hypothetical protein|uniref:DUF3800 domain-containing protein n=1 Tax=Gemmatimonas sp. TaxID=1962908 RepID=UPI0022BDCF34|nr:DUF3800 domain-containing protein [Gemmatimonas sp.]MCE2953641.1 DUF3800 domain-containing protein [Gemmatimonas sp.]MCZ8011929.1 DUF3800 domain-containing protein [Gemmatimonas sp.]MCZ8267247.1 DUF3800 domain-containing protein [Gemmatimonas sp.]